MGLEKVICPRSAAVVGPTDKPGSFGRYAAENALRSAIADHVYFVHPKRDELFGKNATGHSRIFRKLWTALLSVLPLLPSILF